MQGITWGIIGCGDVTEIKSGPAFNKVKNSSLVAVMRRDIGKAQDYARRHKVPAWYNDTHSLINDPAVNAVYVATPPSSHEEYTIAALKAGKPVYVEKPMSTDVISARNMMNIADQENVKLVVAHYRRAQPFFKKIKQLLDEKIVGDIKLARVTLYKKALSAEDLLPSKNLWRVNPGVSGGGLFHDLAPHQLDLALYFFGEVEKADGYAVNQRRLYDADDIVAGNILFKSGVIFTGIWCFTVSEQDETDTFEIIGSAGTMHFSIFGAHTLTISKKDKTEVAFNIPEHVQQPMIEKVVEYFLGEGFNPCSAGEGVKVMQVMDHFTSGKRRSLM